jgi:very-short-patch-repair endonuclease
MSSKMSLTKKHELIEVAKQRCRELRKRQTNPEKLFWERVRDRKLLDKKFYRQYPVFYDELGKETFYIADFCCYEEKIIIELDGKIHESTQAEDKLRDEILEMRGYKVIRFTNSEIENNIDKVMRNITELLNKN